MNGPAAHRLRMVVWAAGVLACGAWYSAATFRAVRVTKFGREVPLFPINGVEVRVIEKGRGGGTVLCPRWVIPAPRPAASPPGVVTNFLPVSAWRSSAPAPPSPPAPLSLGIVWDADRFWPGAAASPRRLDLVAGGSWQWKGGALRRLWHFPATFWTDRDTLFAQGWDAERGDWIAELDPATSRTHLAWKSKWEKGGPEGPRPAVDIWSFYIPANTHRVRTALAREVPADKAREWTFRRKMISLAEARDGAIIAGGGDPVRVVRIVESARLLELTDTGRTLYFEREGWLWRLELRQPLPELLDADPEVTVPGRP